MATSNPSLSLRDIAYERIKESIRLASVHPGEPLSETRLSKQLGISRTPVREALQLLAQEGLVQVIPGRAVTVAAPSVREVMDAIHLRSLLEPEVVRLATHSISSAQLAKLRAALEGLETAVEQDDRAAWLKSDHVFHETLSRACPNQLLGEMSLQMRNRVSYLAVDARGDIERLRACNQEYRRILEKIALADADGAAETMLEHIGTLRASIISRLSQRY